MSIATAILVKCRVCSHEFRVPGALRGRQVACPYCAKPVAIEDKQEQKKDPLLDQQIGGCRLTKRLGAGGLGAVYQAERLADGMQVAVKMLSTNAAKSPEMVARFEREANLAIRVNHPSVVAVYDHGKDRGVHYIVMELVSGGSLAGIIEERGKLPWDEASHWVLQVADALDVVKQQGIIHRDIKPANILIDSEGKAKLADLGLGKQVEGDDLEEQAVLTMQGAAMGSPRYMPPEQIEDASEASYPADVYALGATYYHCLCGEPPFMGKSAAEIMGKVLHELPAPPNAHVPDLPKGINKLVLMMLDKNVEERPGHAGVVAGLIKDLLQNPDKIPVLKKARKGGGGMVAFIIILLLVLAAGGAAYWWFIIEGNPLPF